MKWGMCCGLDKITEAVEAGFDYTEPPARNIGPDVHNAKITELMGMVDQCPIRPEAFNCFIPGDLKITGPEADLERLVQYVETVLPRASAMGARRMVFGSGGSRGVPEGFPHENAMRQIEKFLQAIDPIAGSNDIIIAIEPLCSKECNIINLVQEAHRIAKKLQLTHIGSLADLYHMGQDREPYENLFGTDTLHHVHIAHPVTRQCPMPDDGTDYAGFFKALRRNGYDARISYECGWDDVAKQAPQSLEFLRSEWEQVS